MLKKFIAVICTAAIMCGMLFTGCGSAKPLDSAATQPTEPAVPISVKDPIPYAYVDDAYELTNLINAEEDVEYSFAASYVDPQSGETEELVVKREKITPKVEADIQVTITAAKEGKTASVNVVVPVYISADAVDRLLQSGGAAGEASTGVSKILTKDAAYLQSENSTSSLEVSFSNPESGNDGANLMTLSHYSLLPYYSAKVMDNAAVTFWVYNPMDQNVDFKLTSYNPVTFKTLLWDSADNTQVQTAQPGQWTQIKFSLYDMGIEQALYTSLDGVRDDMLKVCARYAGTGECKIYMDGVDIVHAESVDLVTGYSESEPPAGDYTDLLSSCEVYTNETVAELTTSTNGNGTKTAYRFGADTKVGYPTFYIDFPEVTDISGFDYLSFDVYAEKCYPYVTAAVRYLDENGEEQKHGTSYDFYRDQWRTIYVNLDYLRYADLTKAVGLCFSINIDSHFVDNAFNCVYFDNVKLYRYDEDEPQIASATVEDNDLLNNPFYAANIKPNTSGVSKVATDETGTAKSNSALLFWTNNACGYPNVYAHFVFEQEQDWSGEKMLNLDTHQYNGHYWMGFTIITLDEEGKEKTYFWRHDTVLTHWMTTCAPFDWFRDSDGNSASPEDFKRVIGMQISVDMAVNVTDEVACIFFDNVYVS